MVTGKHIDKWSWAPHFQLPVKLLNFPQIWFLHPISRTSSALSWDPSLFPFLSKLLLSISKSFLVFPWLYKKRAELFPKTFEIPSSILCLNPWISQMVLQLFFTLAFSAVPLTLYVPPVRSLNLFVEAMESLLRESRTYSNRVYPRVRVVWSRLLDCMLCTNMR